VGGGILLSKSNDLIISIVNAYLIERRNVTEVKKKPAAD